ncbi:MAG: hypothetical protein P8075_17735 [Deltaproteobacteria bacterium]
MSDDFGYLNARIRVRRGQLLHEGFFHEALSLSFAEVVMSLAKASTVLILLETPSPTWTVP